MALPASIPGESALQYGLRAGLSYADAAEWIAFISAGNGESGDLPQMLQSYINVRAQPVGQPGGLGGGWGLGEPDPVNLGPEIPRDQTWVGNVPGANVLGGVATPSTPVAGAPPLNSYPNAGIQWPGFNLQVPPPGTTPMAGWPGSSLLPPMPGVPGGGGGTAPPVPTAGAGGGGGIPGVPPSSPRQLPTIGASSPYGMINLLLPGYGIEHSNLGGFGIPGVDTGKVQNAGGSWAGTHFYGPGPATGGTQFDPRYDPLSVFQAGQAAATQTPGVATGGGQQNTANIQGQQIYLGDRNPDNGEYAQPGYVWRKSGADDPKWNQEMNLNDPFWSSQDITNAQAAGTATTSAPVTGQSIGGWGIQKAVPWLTTSFLQHYDGKPAPFANIHEQIGKSMQGVPAAIPGFQWSTPEMMFAAQPGATGMPPGGWTQMLGYTPGAPSNYGFTGGRPNPYGTGMGAVGINPTIG